MVSQPVEGKQHVVAGRGVGMGGGCAIVDACDGGSAAGAQGGQDAVLIVDMVVEHRAWGQVEEQRRRLGGGVMDTARLSGRGT